MGFKVGDKVRVGMNGSVFESATGSIDQLSDSGTSFRVLISDKAGEFRVWCQPQELELQFPHPVPRKKKGEYLVPYDLDGNMLAHEPRPWHEAEYEMRENIAFRAELVLVSKKPKSYSPYGRGSKYYWSKGDTIYPMFPVSLYKAISDGATVVSGTISGVWAATKKGSAYGIEWQGE